MSRKFIREVSLRKGGRGLSGLLLMASASNHQADALYILQQDRNDIDVDTVVVSGEGLGNTPLHFAVKYRAVKLIAALKSRGANENLQNARGLTPFGMAFRLARLDSDYWKVVLAILHGREVDRSKEHVDFEIYSLALFYAVQSDQLAVVQHLLNLGVNPNEVETVYGNTPLHLATLKQSKRMMEVLVSAGAKPTTKSKYGLTPLSLVTLELVGKDINCWSLVPILVKEHKAKTNEEKACYSQALVLAIAAKQVKAAKGLLESGADPNYVIPKGSFKGWAPLHCAVRSQLSDIITELLSRGANREALNLERRSPLDCVIHFTFKDRSYFSLIPALVSNYRPPQTHRFRYSNALLYAALGGDPESVRSLLSADADPNYQKPFGKFAGYTALHFGLLNRREDHLVICLTLVIAGANPQLKARDGVSVVDLSRQLYRHRFDLFLCGDYESRKRAAIEHLKMVSSDQNNSSSSVSLIDHCVLLWNYVSGNVSGLFFGVRRQIEAVDTRVDQLGLEISKMESKLTNLVKESTDYEAQHLQSFSELLNELSEIKEALTQMQQKVEGGGNDLGSEIERVSRRVEQLNAEMQVLNKTLANTRNFPVKTGASIGISVRT